MTGGRMARHWALLVALLGLARATESGFSFRGDFKGVYDEGETAILVCAFTIGNDTFLEDMDHGIVWRPYGQTSYIPIVDNGTLTYIGDRFADVKLDIQYQPPNTNVEFQVSVLSVTRYDTVQSTFGCRFARRNGVEVTYYPEPKVDWSKPAVQCSEPDDWGSGYEQVTAGCTVLDTDPGYSATGSLSIWQGEHQFFSQHTENQVAEGTIYTLNGTFIPDLTATYQCRYEGTGGYQGYLSNCTFHAPDTSAGMPSRPSYVLALGLALLVLGPVRSLLARVNTE